MSVSYKPLWRILVDAGMNKKQLSKETGVSPPTISKMGKNEYVALEVLERICKYFNCQLNDVVEIIPEESRENEKR